MSDHRESDGRFRESVSDGDLLFYFEAGDRPFYGASEVAEYFDISRQQAHRRLTNLEEEGQLRRINLGSRNIAWWKPRDVVVLRQEDEGYSAHDTTKDVASQGDSRADALRMLADAIELQEEGGPMLAGDIYEELEIDPEDTDGTDSFPF